MSENKKIAISINLAWPLKRYHELYAGIQAYNNEITHWKLVWDHFPEIYLKKSKDEPYYDGIIGRIKHDAYLEAKRLNVPVVNIWRSSNLEEMPSVFHDYREAGRMAAEHLIKRGFRNFANIDHRISKSSKDFYAGFAEAVKPYNGFFKKYLFNRNCEESPEQWEKFHNNFAEWIKEWKFPIGIACSMSSIGPKITTRLIEHGINIPNQASVISAGNDLSYCEGHSPKISSVNIDYHKVGYEAARMMDVFLQGKEPNERNIVIPSSNIVSRETTDAYVVDDKEVKMALRFIADNYERYLQVVDIVDQVSVARRSLELRFKKTVGHTIIDEINRHKVTSLKRLLLETDLKVNKLHERLGFSCPHHMRRVFKKGTGMTPGEFRKEMQSERSL